MDIHRYVGGDEHGCGRKLLRDELYLELAIPELSARCARFRVQSWDLPRWALVRKYGECGESVAFVDEPTSGMLALFFLFWVGLANT